MSPPPPSNDDCDFATFITAGTSCSFTIYNNNSATVSTNPRPSTCNSGSYKDVWFKFVVPASGRVIIETQAIDITSGGLALYKGTCNTLTTTPVACTFSSSTMPELDVSAGISYGDTLLLRFWANSSTEFGNFGLCLFSPPVYNTNPIANDLCTSATPICNTNGFQGNTSSSYTNTELPGNNLATVFTNTIEHNSWLSFIANASTSVLNVFVNNCTSNLGIEMQVLSTSNCVNFVGRSAIWGPGSMQNGTITATGLTVGQTYYLMVDGYNGDNCDYIISAASGVTTVYAGKDTTICSGHSINITATGPTTGATYTWTKHDASGISNVGTGYTKSVTPLINTTYTVAVSGANLCTGIKDSLFVTVNSCTCAISGITTTPTCSGNSYALAGTISYSYPPSTGTLTITDGSKTQTFNAPFSTSTNYSLTSITPDGLTHTVTAVFSAIPSCTFSTTYTAPAIPTVSINSPTICAGANATLTATGGTTYSWWGGYGTANPLVVRPTTTKNYIVTATLNGCTSTAQTTVTVNPVPTPNITPTSPIICSGQNTLLTASGGVSYLWDNSSTSSIITVSPPNTSNYSVTVTDSKGCTATKGIQISVNSFGLATASIKPSIICKGDIAILNASSGDSYAWSSGDISQTVNVSPLVTTTYTLTITNSGCTETASVTLTVNDVPTVDAGPNQSICYGTSTTISATAGGSRYQWSSTQIGNPITANPISTTTYSVTMSDVNGCTATDNMVLTVNPNPTVTISKNKPVTCTGDTVVLTASGADTYTWGSFGTNAAITVTPTSSTIYRVTGTALQCTKVASITVSIIPLPTLSVNSPPICIGSSVNLTVSGASTYSWSDGLGTNSTVTVSPSISTTYTATGTASGCSKTIQSIVTVSTPSIGGDVTGGSSICSGTPSNLLTLSGEHGSVVKWQWSTDGSIWTDIANTNTTYTSGNLTQTTQYRAYVQSGVCQAATSTPTSVTISTPSAGGNVTGGTTICEGNTSGLLTLNGYTGSILKWQYSTDGTIWNDISNTNSTYISNNLVQTTQFRAVIQNGACPTVFSTSTTVTVNPISISGNVTGGSTICTGNTSSILTLSGNTGSVNKWQYSIDGTNWSDITNTNSTFTSGILTQTTQFRAVVQVGICPAYSGSTTVTVSPVSIGGSISGGSSICAGLSSGLLTLNGQIGTVSKWQYSTNGSTWTDIVNTSNTYTSSALNNTTQFRAQVQSGTCPSTYSATTTIIVNAASYGGSVSGGATICTGNNSPLLTLSGNTGSITKWQSSINGGNSWTDIANSSTTYSPGILTQLTQFRAVAQNGSCPESYSIPATINVDAQSVGGSITGGTTICAGSSVTLTLNNYIGNIVKWRSSSNSGSTWNDINNTNNTYTTNTITQNTLISAVVQNGVCPVIYSNYTLVNVNSAPIGGTVNSSSSICSGNTAPQLVLNGNTGTISKWQYSTNLGSSWTDITNTNTTYSPGILTQTTQYRAAITSGVCPITYSSAAIISVDDPAIGGILSGGSTICYNNNSPLLALTGNNGIINKWQYSTNGGTSWTDIINSNNTYTSGQLTQSTDFRVAITNGACSTYSNVTTVFVTPISVGGSIQGSTSICINSTIPTLTLSGNIGNVIKWQFTEDGTIWNDIANTNSTFSPLSITTTTQYRAVIQNGVCPQVYSISGTITVDNPSIGGNITPDQTICLGNAPAILSLTGSTGDAIQWQVSSNAGTTWTNIANSQNTYTLGNQNTLGTFKYRAEVKNGACPSIFSNPATIIVNTSILSSFTTTPNQVCENTDLTINYTGNASYNASYNWNFDGGISSSTSTQGPYLVHWNTAGTHNITLTVVENGCSSITTTNSISVKSAPSSAFNTTSTMCPYDTAKISYTGTVINGANYNWSIPNGIHISGNSTGPGPLYYKWNNSGTYNISLVVSANGCSSISTTQTIVVKKQPTSFFSYTDTICPKSNTFFNYTGDASNNATFNYTFTSSANHSGSGSGPYTASWNTSGNYTVTLIVTENGCHSNASTQPITVRTPTPISFNANPIRGCVPLTVSFADYTTNAKNWTWNFTDPSSDSTTSHIRKPIHTFNKAGSYDIQLTLIDENGCTNTKLAPNFINVDNKPTPDFSWNPPVGSIEYPILTFNSLNTPPENIKWKWKFHDSIKFDTTQSTKHRYDNAGVYPVVMYVWSKNGCFDSIVKNVQIKESLTFYIPNCFSPNGDGLNDYFGPEMNGVKLSGYEMDIFSRFGTLVYHTSDLSKPWDGTVLNKSEEKTPGVYTWIIKIVDLDGASHYYHGTLTLIH